MKELLLLILKAVVGETLLEELLGLLLIQQQLTAEVQIVVFRCRSLAVTFSERLKTGNAK
jgi:hypothetical protein